MNLLGIDFEEWYHPELIKPHVKTKPELKVTFGIDKILEWLRKKETFATFFVVGELIEKEPSLIDKIILNGHEIAFHTMNHDKLSDIGKEKFVEELEQFKRLTSDRSKGFRAPTFSLNKDTSWAIDKLVEKKYQYDSSVVPVKTRMYGIPNAKNEPYKITSNDISNGNKNGELIEFPLMVTRFVGKKVPAGGGFYLRALPLKIIKNAINQYEKLNVPSTFYIHSWELVPELMPKIQLPVVDKFITYYNIKNALPKMSKLLDEFEFTSFEKFTHKMNN